MDYAAQLRACSERRRAIVEHRRKSGSNAETARAFGITRERVRQIVNQEEGKDAALRQDREVLGGNGLHPEGHSPEDRDGRMG